MNKNFLFLFASMIFCHSLSIAQPIPPESIEDSVIGWMKVYHFKGTKEPQKVDNKYYTSAQLSICDTLANWIQASYIPKGGWGDIKKAVSDKLGLYNQFTEGKPQSYGAKSATYTELKYNSSHKMELYTSANIYWGVFANKVPGDWPVRDICSPTQYYFTMPSAETEEENVKIKQQLDLTNQVNIKPYISFWIKNMGFGRGVENVLLCKDNKSPFIKITKGEYLQALESGLSGYYASEKKKIIEQEQGIQSRIDVSVKYLDEKMERFNEGLRKNREKYKNRLGELALTSTQPSISDLDNGNDLFSYGKLTDPESTAGRVPVYKIDPVMAELCKKDKPQWILVSWDYYPGAIDPVEKQQHEAIINNFNFEYVYNFFFAPEKVKGQPYTPLRSPLYQKTVVVMEKSEISKKNTLDNSVYFYEDFSTTDIGQNPNGWKVKANIAGASCVVTTVEGTSDKWATIEGSNLVPNNLKKPLPPNFTFSYDVIVPENFTWGAKGLVLLLSKEKNLGVVEDFIRLKIRPGSGGSDGEVELETKFPSEYANGTKWYVATGFSNNKKINRINVTIKKSGEAIQFFIDKKMIAEYVKGMPSDMVFNALSFDMGRSDGETEKYYIGNIKITKD